MNPFRFIVSIRFDDQGVLVVFVAMLLRSDSHSKMSKTN
jgi:hypothetical protein